MVVRSAPGGVGHVTRPSATGDAYSARVRHYMGEILAGRWRAPCQDNIVIAYENVLSAPLPNGHQRQFSVRLINGQHRLTALYEAAGMVDHIAKGVPALRLPFSFAFGVDIDTYRVMDTVLVRGASAALENDGCEYPKIGAAAIKRALRYLDGRSPDGRGDPISPEKVHEKYVDWEENLDVAFDACMRFGSRSGAPLLLTQSSAVALHLLMQLTSESPRRNQGSLSEIDQFFYRLHTGFQIADGRDPIGKARKELSRLPVRETEAQRAAIVVRAWNAGQGGPKNGLANWRATDQREQFPRIL